MDAQHVKYHAFSMKWFRKLRDVSRLFIAVDRRSVLLLACLCAMQASLIFLQSLVGPVIGSFYSSIIDNDTSAFSNNIVWALLVFACISILDAALKWLSESMEVMWRRSLASELHGLYSTPPLTSQPLSRIDLTHVCVRYMHERCVSHGVFSKLDNPDQRLAQEVTQFTSALSGKQPLAATPKTPNTSAARHAAADAAGPHAHCVLHVP